MICDCGKHIALLYSRMMYSESTLIFLMSWRSSFRLFPILRCKMDHCHERWMTPIEKPIWRDSSALC
uniref:Uncharacterized protein n=1 Tax=Arundo donax TaxID=35708 RepID=A0A0A9G3H3_ARUDO